MISNTAILWIRDGVLVNRMHLNPVAFAFAAWIFSDPAQRQGQRTLIEDLINFGFEKSGISCADKMRLYNSERENMVTDVEAAADYYNQLASEAASDSSYFKGTIELLRDLQAAGAQNFITSAVEQDVLTKWCQSEHGQTIAPYLSEVLGARPNFSKGRDHFQYVANLGCKTIYYIADAPSEISTGKQYSCDFNIVPIGFGNVITNFPVVEAIQRMYGAMETIGMPRASDIRDLGVAPIKFKLADEAKIKTDLMEAGAEAVITGSQFHLMANLRKYFQQRSLLSEQGATAKP